MSQAGIIAEGLIKHFGSVKALDGVDFEVPESSVLGLLGPNGAGKTTAVRVLTTLLKPDAGRAIVGGHDVVNNPGEVRRLIGLTGQYAAVDELLSGDENLYMIGRLIGLRRKDAKARAAQLLESFALADSAKKAVKTYSGGMRRKLDLAASLVGQPRFLFLDEPTTGLDLRSRHQLWDLIRDLVKEGSTVMLTTQYLEEADLLSDHIVVIDHGRVVGAGTPDQLKERVGGQVLEVELQNESDLDVASKVLSELADAESSFDQEEQLITVPIPDPALVAAAVRRLDELNISLAHLAMRRPGLDEAFLALTGHGVETEEQIEKEPERSMR